MAGCVLAVALALPCPALEAHVREVLTERRQVVEESVRLRVCDNGDLELLGSGQLDTSSSRDTSSCPPAPHPVCTQMLDLTEMVHALAPSLPHLARVLAAHAAWSSEAPVRSALFFGAASAHSTGSSHGGVRDALSHTLPLVAHNAPLSGGNIGLGHQTPGIAFTGHQTPGIAFSKVLSTLILLHSKCIRGMTFDNVCEHIINTLATP